MGRPDDRSAHLWDLGWVVLQSAGRKQRSKMIKRVRRSAREGLAVADHETCKSHVAIIDFKDDRETLERLEEKNDLGNLRTGFPNSKKFEEFLAEDRFDE